MGDKKFTGGIPNLDFHICSVNVYNTTAKFSPYRVLRVREIFPLSVAPQNTRFASSCISNNQELEDIVKSIRFHFEYLRTPVKLKMLHMYTERTIYNQYRLIYSPLVEPNVRFKTRRGKYRVRRADYEYILIA